jgi:hypothetical protein
MIRSSLSRTALPIDNGQSGIAANPATLTYFKDYGNVHGLPQDPQVVFPSPRRNQICGLAISLLPAQFRLDTVGLLRYSPGPFVAGGHLVLLATDCQLGRGQ